MKLRKWLVVLFALILVLSLSLPILAANDSYLADEADILTDEEESSLSYKARSISEMYDCGIYIVTVWDYSSYGSSVRLAAEEYFLAQDMGYGEEDDGVLLFLSMADRDYALIAHGDLANSVFSDYRKDLLSDTFLDNFGRDDWYGGFTDYLRCSMQFLEAPAEESADLSSFGDGMSRIVLRIFLPAVIAALICGFMAVSMKTARVKTHANEYLDHNGFHIMGQHDRFINKTVVRHKIESSSSSGKSRSHSSGSRVNSRGFSGKSGKF